MIRAVAADGSSGTPWLKAGALVLAIHVGVLASVIGTRPRTSYLAKVRNPAAALATAHGGHDGGQGDNGHSNAEH